MQRPRVISNGLIFLLYRWAEIDGVYLSPGTGLKYTAEIFVDIWYTIIVDIIFCDPFIG